MAENSSADRPDALPLAHFAQADRIRADVAETEWRLATRRQQGRSIALILGTGRSVTQLAQGQVSMRAPCFLWLPPGAGQVARVAPGSEGFFLSLNEDLVARAAQGGNASSELRSVADRLIHGEGAPAAKHILALLPAAEAIHQELREPGHGGMALLIAHATVILVHAWRLAGFQISHAETDWTGSAIFQRFLQAVELHFREDWPVSRYAGQLGVTERRLHAPLRGPRARARCRSCICASWRPRAPGSSGPPCPSRRSAMASAFPIQPASAASSKRRRGSPPAPSASAGARRTARTPPSPHGRERCPPGSTGD